MSVIINSQMCASGILVMLGIFIMAVEFGNNGNVDTIIALEQQQQRLQSKGREENRKLSFLIII